MLNVENVNLKINFERKKYFYFSAILAVFNNIQSGLKTWHFTFTHIFANC